MSFANFGLAMRALGLVFFFIALTFIVPKVELLAALNGTFLGVVVAAIIVYFKLIVVTVHKTKLDRVSQLALGVGLLFFSIAGQKFYWIVWKSNGSPESWQSNYLLSALAFIAIIGGGLFATAPGYPPANVTLPVDVWGANRRLLLLSGCIGGVSAWLLSVYNGVSFN